MSFLRKSAVTAAWSRAGVCVCLHAGMCEISVLLFAGIKNKTQVYSTFIKAFIDLASQNPQCCALK